MNINFEQADTKFKEVVNFLTKDLSSLRAGRANPQMLDGIKVDVYGQTMPINQVANINIVDATLITVNPWDKNNIEAIVKAISESDLGINAISEGDVIKLPIPPLTEERRFEYVKIMKGKIEEARIAVRQVRKDILDAIAADKEKNLITEDDEERLEKDLQKKVDDVNDQIEKIAESKEKELMEV